MEKFWVSNNGQVSPEMTREEIQEQYINAGASLDIHVLKVGDGTEWKTARHYDFKPGPSASENAAEEESEEGYKAVSPVIFLNGKHFCYVYGKTESDRSRLSHALADFLNTQNFKTL